MPRNGVKEKIGFKGIGFKSVFKDCNFVFINSGGFSFRFDNSKFLTPKPYQIIPIWTETIEVDKEIVETIIFKNSTVSIALKPVSYTHLTLPTNREV